MQDVSRGEGRTVLFVSHNMASIRKLCNTGVLLHNGNVIYNGTANDAVNYYISGTDITTEKIVNNINWINKKIRIDKITFNGTDSVNTKIAINQRTIDISVEGYANEDIESDLSFVIKNLDEVPLASYSIGHFNGKRDFIKKGKFEINRIAQLPTYISRGECIVDIFMHNPNIEYLFKAPNCIRVEFIGTQLDGCDSVDMNVCGLIGIE